MTTGSDEFDSPWKDILEVYFEEFIAFFFSEAHADIEWSRPVEFLDKELQQVVRDAEFGRRYVDKLAKVWRKDGTEQWVLAHIEIQGQYEAAFDERMYTCHYRLFDRYRRRIASFAVLTDDNPTWQPGKYESQLWGCTLSFVFPVAKLTEYKAQWAMLETSNNPFAIVVMAHLKTQETRHRTDERRFWKFHLIRHLYERGYGRQAIINLFHFIDWVMQLPPDAEAELWQELAQLEGEKKMQYISSLERISIQKGMEQGRQEGALHLLLRVLSHRFGEIPEAVEARLQKLSTEQIDDLVDLALTYHSLSEFMAQLPDVAST